MAEVVWYRPGMGASLRLCLASLAIAAGLSAACGSDDNQNRNANQNCAGFSDPCRRCSCQVCPCDSACESGLAVYYQCIDGCFSQSGGEAVRNCMNGCENATTGTTRVNLSCTEAAVADDCQSVCQT